MGKKAPAPPPAPDYAAQATAQGKANQDAGYQTASLSNPNIYNPYGGQSVTYAPTGPNGAMQPTVSQWLNPDAQAALDAQQKVQMQQANLAQQGMTQASDILSKPFQYQGPGIQTSLGDLPQAQTSLGNYGTPQMSLGNYGSAQTTLGDYGNVQTSLGDYQKANGSLDLSGIANMPVNAGTTGQAAIMARLNPQIAQQDEALRQQAANQGIGLGSEAYTNLQRDNNAAKNDLYSQASLYGLGLDMQANQQGYNQALQTGMYGNAAAAQNFQQQQAAGQFANEAQQQRYGQAFGAGQFANQGQQQNYLQNLGAAQFGNSAQQQQYDQMLGAGQFANQGYAQNYNQALGAAQFGNSAVAQSLQHQLGLYNQPLNQINSLLSGSQIQTPQFQQYAGNSISAAPIFDAAKASGQFAQDSYGQQMAGYNAQMQALGQVVAAPFGMFKFGGA